MLATLRNRRGIVSGVEPFDGPDGVTNLVSVEYVDTDGQPEDQVVWENEPGARVVPPAALPNVNVDAPMALREFNAMVRATRWSAISPYMDPDGPEGPLTRFPISSPLHGAIQAEDFQLMPLLKAMLMPRIALLIADDVGLGKTIEAGLILAELIIRRRLRRVLIITPASLKAQWRDEMREKFAIHFDEVDRQATNDLRKSMGLDANPWRTFQRVVASYHYLKQPDVLEQFCAASRTPQGSPHLPWDLLIVDEAHNCAPAAMGEESDLAKMLSIIAPLFEHRIFLTATPHNGHTRSFTGLLEKLDPVRFHQSAELKGAAKRRVPDVVVRRLKREINAKSDTPRFSERFPSPVPVSLSPHERELSAAFSAFRRKLRQLIAQAKRGEQLAGSFAVEILGKRLLSCPYAFADSWQRYKRGLDEQDAAEAADVRAAEKRVREESEDDLEAESRAGFAANAVGAWLKPLAKDLAEEMQAIDAAVKNLALTGVNATSVVIPTADSRYDALKALITAKIRNGGSWRDDERLVVFTEYKTTMDYLFERLTKDFSGEGRVDVLYGGMDGDDREAIKAAFNDPADPVRILVATDAASEGLNLHETAHLLMHFDVPWNPSRLEQRNGRLDRHGQARDVFVHYFESDDDADMRFLAYVVSKVNAIREDLGSVGEIFDAAFEKRFIDGHDEAEVRRGVDTAIDRAIKNMELPRDSRVSVAETLDDASGISEKREIERLVGLREELDIDPAALKDTLEAALGVGAGVPRFAGPDEKGRHTFVHPIPGQWENLIDDTLRTVGRRGVKGTLRSLLFDPVLCMTTTGGRPVFRPVPGSALMHLAHPMYHKAMATFARLRFPGPGTEVKATRWAVTRGEVPAGADALVLLTIEEIAVNELRETFHHWVRTIRLPIKGSRLGEPLPHIPAAGLRGALPGEPSDATDARELWEEIDTDVRDFIKGRTTALSKDIARLLKSEYEDARKLETERFRSRQGELSEYINQLSLQKIENEIEDLRLAQMQTDLFKGARAFDEYEHVIEEKEEEMRRRTRHYEELRKQLERERERIMDFLLPRRFALRGSVNCFPVAVEIRLPGGSR
jgi:superfamily II DNA or RNA helicase